MAGTYPYAVNCIICNQTAVTLTLVSSSYSNGEWGTQPPQTIDKLSSSKPFGTNNTSIGAAGSVTYGATLEFDLQIALQIEWSVNEAGTGYQYTITPPWAYTCLAYAGSGGVNPNPADVNLVFFPTTDPENWMQDNIGTLGSRTLKQICIPGSHDAGMSTFGPGSTVGAAPCNTLTQTTGIAGQLASGARYFDIRPVISDGNYDTGHYSGSMGADGQSISSVISDINAFTANHNELIILYLSHDCDTDSAGYPAFNEIQWQALFDQMYGPDHMGGLNHLFTGQSDTIYLDTEKIENFICPNNTQPRPCVLVVIDPEDTSMKSFLAGFAQDGVFTSANYDPYNCYADKQSTPDMIADQVGKMILQEHPLPPATPKYFLFSWTLTQSDYDAVMCGFGSTARPAILDLVVGCNPLVFSQLLPNCNYTTFPNILLMDDFNNQNASAAFGDQYYPYQTTFPYDAAVTDLVMAINLHNT
ncbi:MAG: hypothetical protein ABR889_00205 [Acidobacteriaceae bacterium]|jgi:hypothetical protein